MTTIACLSPAVAKHVNYPGPSTQEYGVNRARTRLLSRSTPGATVGDMGPGVCREYGISERSMEIQAMGGHVAIPRGTRPGGYPEAASSSMAGSGVTRTPLIHRPAPFRKKGRRQLPTANHRIQTQGEAAACPFAFIVM